MLATNSIKVFLDNGTGIHPKAAEVGTYACFLLLFSHGVYKVSNGDYVPGILLMCLTIILIPITRWAYSKKGTYFPFLELDQNGVLVKDFIFRSATFYKWDEIHDFKIKDHSISFWVRNDEVSMQVHKKLIAEIKKFVQKEHLLESEMIYLPEDMSHAD